MQWSRKTVKRFKRLCINYDGKKQTKKHAFDGIWNEDGRTPETCLWPKLGRQERKMKFERKKKKEVHSKANTARVRRGALGVLLWHVHVCASSLRALYALTAVILEPLE